MKIVVDMNLSPDWVKVLEHAGWDTVHWSMVGDMRATDEVIMSWARENGYIVFTHDLDFGVLLALTRAESPSVIQIRTHDVFPQALGDRLIKVGSLGFAVKDSQIWGCVRAYARTHPQIWPFLTLIPKEPKSLERTLIRIGKRCVAYCG